MMKADDKLRAVIYRNGVPVENQDAAMAEFVEGMGLKLAEKLRRAGVLADTSEARARVAKLVKKAEGQVAYWRGRQAEEKSLDAAYDEYGNQTPIGDHAAWKAGYCNGRFSEADWWLSAILIDLASPASPQEEARKLADATPKATP